MSARRFAAALALALCASAASAQQHHAASDTHAYVAPSPGDLGGAISLRDPAGALFSNDNLRGSWTMLYFGYGRCRSACPIAVPTLAAAVDGLRARGVSARAVFVDIEASPAPIRLRATAGQHAPPGHADHAAPLQLLAEQFPSITFLTGSRLQIRQALTAFRVRTEHVPARVSLGESGHSINHTTAIYVIDPAGAVAGYVYHDVRPRTRSLRHCARDALSKVGPSADDPLGHQSPYPSTLRP